MKIKTNIKAGDYPPGPTKTNHNQTVAGGLNVKTNLKAGDYPPGPSKTNHSQTVARVA